jgi:hypothetical protein
MEAVRRVTSGMTLTKPLADIQTDYKSEYGKMPLPEFIYQTFQNQW